MSGQYNLNGLVVFDSEEGMGWVEWIMAEDGSLNTLIGDVKIDRAIDVTVLGPTKSRSGEPNYKTLAEVREFVSSLPEWRQTKFFNRISETGSSGLMDCASGEIIDPGFAYDLVPQLVIKYNNSSEEVNCAICGNKTTGGIPFGLFLFDRSAAAPFRLVCDACGSTHAEALFAILTRHGPDEAGITGFHMEPDQ